MRDPVRGATRIYAEATPTAADFAPGSPKPKAPDSYLTTLLKLIPSEIVAGYVAVGQMWQSKGYLLVWFWLCMVACFLFRAYASLPKDQPGGPKQVQWVAVLITCGSPRWEGGFRTSVQKSAHWGRGLWQFLHDRGDGIAI